MLKAPSVTLTTVLLIVLVLLLGSLPVYSYSNSWGYAPSGLLTVVLAMVALLALF